MSKSRASTGTYLSWLDGFGCVHHQITTTLAAGTVKVQCIKSTLNSYFAVSYYQNYSQATLDYLINVMYGISEMALNKDSYYLVFLLIGIYFLILQKQISKQHVYQKVQSKYSGSGYFLIFHVQKFKNFTISVIHMIEKLFLSAASYKKSTPLIIIIYFFWL